MLTKDSVKPLIVYFVSTGPRYQLIKDYAHSFNEKVIHLKVLNNLLGLLNFLIS